MKRVGGFTLVEVAVALAILALALGVLYQTFGWGLRRAAATQQRELALLTAQSLLAHVRGGNRLRPSVETGQTQEGLEWRWDIRERPVAIDTISPFRAFEVTIEVGWGEREAQRVRLQSIETGRVAS